MVVVVVDGLVVVVVVDVLVVLEEDVVVVDVVSEVLSRRISRIYPALGAQLRPALYGKTGAFTPSVQFAVQPYMPSGTLLSIK